MNEPLSKDPRAVGLGHDLQPQVDLPREAIPMPLLIALTVALAIGLFLYLDADRRARLDTPSAAKPLRLQPPPPPLLIPPAPEPVATPAALATPAGSQSAMVAPPKLAPRMDSPAVAQVKAVSAPPPMPIARSLGGEPALVVDLTTGVGGQPGAAGAGDVADEAVRATTIRNRASVIPQGAIIAAVLETPLNSDRPGLARALISQDVRSFDGSRVLIPRGSRLIGEFRAEAGAQLSRVLVNWSRLIRPDGVAIRIGSPVTDSLGGAGAPGRVNSHFLERFGSAVLQSALTIGVNVASQLPTNNGSIYVGVPGQVAQVGQQLVPNVNRAPTVKVPGGAQIAVLVARDLDFGGTPAVR